jgi:hypothetical protein
MRLETIESLQKKKKQGTNKKNYTKFEKSKNKKPKLKDIIEEKKPYKMAKDKNYIIKILRIDT